MRKVACCLARQQTWTRAQNTDCLLLPTFQQGFQSSRLAENLRIKRIEWLKVTKVKTEQRANNYEKCLKEGLSMRKIGPGAIVSLVVSLQRTINMLGEQITAGQLTNHERITILL